MSVNSEDTEDDQDHRTLKKHIFTTAHIARDVSRAAIFGITYAVSMSIIYSWFLFLFFWLNTRVQHLIIAKRSASVFREEFDEIHDLAFEVSSTGHGGSCRANGRKPPMSLLSARITN